MNKIFVAIPTGGGFSVVRVLALYCVPIVVMRGELVLDIGSLFLSTRNVAFMLSTILAYVHHFPKVFVNMK